MRRLCAILFILVLAGGLIGAPSVEADIAGFGDGTGWTLNADANAQAAGVPKFLDVGGPDYELQLTVPVNYVTTSAFNETAQGVEMFTGQFDYQYLGSTGAPADGIAFVLQNNASGVNALGATGGGLGYLNMTTSVALLMNIYQAWEVGIQVAADGAFASADHVSSSPVDASATLVIETKNQIKRQS